MAQKLFSCEVRMAAYLFLLMSSNAEVPLLAVPLCGVVKYMGFSIFVSSILPLSRCVFRAGPFTEDTSEIRDARLLLLSSYDARLQMQALFHSLHLVALPLSHTDGSSGTQPPIFGSMDLRLYESTEDRLLYMLDTWRMVPPMDTSQFIPRGLTEERPNNSVEPHESPSGTPYAQDLSLQPRTESQRAGVPQTRYIGQSQHSHHVQLIRPEALLGESAPTPCVLDCGSSDGKRISKQLTESVITRHVEAAAVDLLSLASDFNQTTVLTPNHLCATMHRHGVNMRLLGVLCRNLEVQLASAVASFPVSASQSINVAPPASNAAEHTPQRGRPTAPRQRRGTHYPPAGEPSSTHSNHRRSRCCDSPHSSQRASIQQRPAAEGDHIARACAEHCPRRNAVQGILRHPSRALAWSVHPAPLPSTVSCNRAQRHP